MIKLPHKGLCKRKQFSRALVVGHFVYMDFMDAKKVKYRWGINDDRDLTPRPKIFKVIAKNKLEVAYMRDKEGNWKTRHEMNDDDFYMWGMFHCGMSTKNIKKHVYNAHVIWSMFQEDRVRNIMSMTKDELAEEFLMELI